MSVLVPLGSSGGGEVSAHFLGGLVALAFIQSDARAGGGGDFAEGCSTGLSPCRTLHRRRSWFVSVTRVAQVSREFSSLPCLRVSSEAVAQPQRPVWVDSGSQRTRLTFGAPFQEAL